MSAEPKKIKIVQGMTDEHLFYSKLASRILRQEFINYTVNSVTNSITVTTTGLNKEDVKRLCSLLSVITIPEGKDPTVIIEPQFDG